MTATPMKNSSCMTTQALATTAECSNRKQGQRTGEENSDEDDEGISDDKDTASNEDNLMVLLPAK
jgi:hypothetical protein